MCEKVIYMQCLKFCERNFGNFGNFAPHQNANISPKNFGFLQFFYEFGQILFKFTQNPSKNKKNSYEIFPKFRKFQFYRSAAAELLLPKFKTLYICSNKVESTATLY